MGASHPAAVWAEATDFAADQLDCITAIMLKVLDGKCKMGAGEKASLAAIYAVTRARPGHRFDAGVHALIATATRAGGDSGAAVQAAVHHWRLQAEATIAKPIMKAFKAELGAALAGLSVEV